MKQRHFIDKRSWEMGPWSNEPDHCAWIDTSTSYPCIARRNALGAWVGMTGVDEHHPLFGVPATADAYNFIKVHGGITDAAFSAEDSLEFEPPKRRWWIGFDCMHKLDLLPSFTKDAKRARRNKKAQYRDMLYVLQQVDSLAMQLAHFDARLIDQLSYNIQSEE